MFKKFDEKEHVSGVTSIKSSVQRSLKASLIQQMPFLADYIDEILPKKEWKLVKCADHIEALAAREGEVVFFKQRDGQFYPSLKLVHKYPFILPEMRVDKGAIKFILSGANIMSPGLTNRAAGAKMTKVDSGTIVAVTAAGKQHALAVGLTKMSSEDIETQNKGIAVENIHYLNDGLWLMRNIK
ncbi:DgyrCDS9011 [Dimorphilus gyrociliatus]|uniref:DgyrCDS9011 n=1 Tax=Dimorphilus gyrociliatus TaxID=2664684 RepID=A0A7I8VVU1_9ANNE|nr:DgyrCDS9011 [Dimorphilus gyrociliatus]